MHSLLTSENPSEHQIDLPTLECNVKNRTNRQVRDLTIKYNSAGITVTGTSRSYYIKQLVTQTIRTHLPETNLENRILVVTT